MTVYYLATGSYSDYSQGPFFLKRKDAVLAKKFLNARLGIWDDDYSGPHKCEVLESFNPEDYVQKEATAISMYRGKMDRSVSPNPELFDEFGIRVYSEEEDGNWDVQPYEVIVLDAWRFTNEELIKIFSDRVAEHKARKEGV